MKKILPIINTMPAATFLLALLPEIANGQTSTPFPFEEDFKGNRLLRTDTDICINQEINVITIGGDADTITDATSPAVAIGDILCTDPGIVKPKAYKGSHKIAMGIVFYVDTTGAHGRAVALQDCASKCGWSTGTEYSNSDVWCVNDHGIGGKKSKTTPPPNPMTAMSELFIPFKNKNSYEIIKKNGELKNDY